MLYQFKLERKFDIKLMATLLNCCGLLDLRVEARKLNCLDNEAGGATTLGSLELGYASMLNKPYMLNVCQRTPKNS
jgi:hypothetical protein